MKEYKYKRHAEWWSYDIRPTKIKKNINSAERWRGKREIQKQLEDDEVHWYGIQYEAYDSEISQSPCVKCQMDFTILDMLAVTFIKMRIVVISDYNRDYYGCEHNKPKQLSDVQISQYYNRK